MGMSWGEKSCKNWGDCSIANCGTCNKKCFEYSRDGSKEDSSYDISDTLNGLDDGCNHDCDNCPKNIMKQPEEPPEPPEPPQLIRSPLGQFNAKRELVILKGCLFELQKITPLKITLKLKRKLTQANVDSKTPMIDGVFVFTQGGKIQKLSKVFRENIILLKAKIEKDL